MAFKPYIGIRVALELLSECWGMIGSVDMGHGLKLGIDTWLLQLTAWVGKRRVMFMVALDGLRVPKTNGVGWQDCKMGPPWMRAMDRCTAEPFGVSKSCFFDVFFCSGQNPSSTDLLARPAPPPTSTHKVWIQNNVIVLLTEREAVQVGGYSQ